MAVNEAMNKICYSDAALCLYGQLSHSVFTIRKVNYELCTAATPNISMEEV